MKNNIKKIMSASIQRIKSGRKKIMVPSALLAGLLTVAIVLVSVRRGSEAETVYRETAAVRGDLTVGITESGTVDIGTTSQTFDLDMSKLVRNSSSDSASGSGVEGGMGMGGSSMGGGDMFSQIFGFASDSGNQNNSSSGSKLTIAEVKASIGQKVKAGDILYLLEEEELSEIRERLESDVEKAEADLQAVYANQKQSKADAQYNYDTSVAYGSAASAEKEAAVKELETAVNNKTQSLEVAKQELDTYKERLAAVQEDFASAKDMLERCEWGAANVDKQQDIYLYVEYESMRTQARNTYDSLDNEVEELTDSIEKAEENIASLEAEVQKAQRELELGKLSAAKNYDLRMLAYNTADETHDIALSYLETDAGEQEDTYEDAKARYQEFQDNITENAICAAYDGVITDISLKAGDTVGTGDKVITLYNMDEVTMAVTVDEDDMSDIAEGSAANVVCTAFPDQPFPAVVSEISDAKTDSSGNVTYEVTVTLQGDVSGLYQGMTGDVTFITKETKEVLYVSNRAVTRSGGKSYVKVKNNGSIKTKEVTTGFSDGVNVEIVEGLSEGDVVLIESKVSD